VTDAQELLPCPFCGGEASDTPPNCHQSTPYDPTDRMYPIVRCKSCGGTAEGACNDGRIDNRSTASAVAAWNTRADTAEVIALRAERDALLAERNEALTNIRAYQVGVAVGRSEGDATLAVRAENASLRKRVEAADALDWMTYHQLPLQLWRECDDDSGLWVIVDNSKGEIIASGETAEDALIDAYRATGAA
jgi:hypothetical protein